MKVAELKQKKRQGFYRRRQIVEKLKDKQMIIRQYHNDERAAHSEIREIIQQMTEIVYGDLLRKNMTQYIQQCLKCQKKDEIRKIGLRGLVERPEKVWSQISIDHITKLPKVKGKDSILVIQDQFSEIIHLKAVSEKETAEQMGQNCCETAWKLHKYSKKIRTDREMVFMSKTGRKKEKEKEITRGRTIAYHLQVNRQMKRMNKKIKTYLRKYINHHQNDGSEYLSMLEFAQNTGKPEKGTYTSYQVVYEETSAITAIKKIKEIQSLKRAQEDTCEEIHDHLASKYQTDNGIYLRRNGRHKDGSSGSLDHKGGRLYKIKRSTDPQDYELDLPSSMKIYSIVNTCNLKKHHEESSSQ